MKQQKQQENAEEHVMPHLTVCRATETAFETHSATINSLRFNKLRSVAAFTPIFSPGGRERGNCVEAGFLKRLRSRYPSIPFIYAVCSRVAAVFFTHMLYGPKPITVSWLLFHATGSCQA
jgi:hypothetical protein